MMEKSQLKKEISTLLERLNSQLSDADHSIGKAVDTLEQLHRKCIQLETLQQVVVAPKTEAVIHTTVTTKIEHTESAAETKSETVHIEKVPAAAAKMDEPKPLEHLTPKQEIKTKNFKGRLSINDRLLFANALFANNAANFEAAVQKINRIDDVKAMEEYLLHLSQTNNWNAEDETVVRFKSLTINAVH